MSGQSAGGATVFDTLGESLGGGVLRQRVGGSADILRALGIPRAAQAESAIPAEVRAALDLPGVGSPETGAGAETATACFELHVGSFVVPFDVLVDLTTLSPYTVLSGTFLFDTVEVSEWKVTDGTFGLSSPSSDTLYILGQLLPPASEVARAESANSEVPWVIIAGWHKPPATYPGIFASSAGLWYQNTLFKGWQPCS